MRSDRVANGGNKPKPDGVVSVLSDWPIGKRTEMIYSGTASLTYLGAKMKKFMAIYMASGADFENMMRNSTPEQRSKGMEAWMKWMNQHKESILEGGAPLGKTKRVDATSISDVKNNMGGYSIVQAETHEAAAKLFGKDHPHLQMPGAWVEILEIMPLPGM